MTWGSVRRLARDRRGTAAVELALVLPVFLAMMLGAVWVGTLSFTVSSLNFAVQSAARCAAVNGQLCSTAAGTTNYALERYRGVGATPLFVSNTTGCGHTVTGQVTFNLNLVPGLTDLPLSSTACYP